MAISLTTFTPNTQIKSSEINANFTNLKSAVEVIALQAKIITGTRDGTANSGDVSYTGVGFKPISIHAIGVVNGTVYMSKGFSDSSKVCSSVYQTSASAMYTGDNLVIYSDQGSFAQSAVVKSYDNDGFTLTWTKAANPPANTITLKFICYGLQT